MFTEFAGEFFDVREAMFDQLFSYNKPDQSRVLIKASLVFIGKRHKVEIRIDLKEIQSGARVLMEQLLEPLGDINYVPKMVSIPVVGGF